MSGCTSDWTMVLTAIFSMAGGCGGRSRSKRTPTMDALLSFIIFLTMLNLSWSLRQKPRLGQINYREEEKRILDSILGRDVYDNRIRPSGRNGTVMREVGEDVFKSRIKPSSCNGTDAATIIVVNLYIRSFAKIDDVKMEYSVQITFRQTWNDDRLSYGGRLNHGDMRAKIQYLTMTDAKKSVDARHVFPKRKRRTISQYFGAKCVH